VPSSCIKGNAAELDQVTAEADYDFRVCGKNSTGKGPWSETEKPITAMDAPGMDFKNLTPNLNIETKKNYKINFVIIETCYKNNVVF